MPRHLKLVSGPAILLAAAFTVAQEPGTTATTPTRRPWSSAEKLVKDVFRQEYASAKTDRAAGKELAATLLKQAKEIREQQDAAVRFVALREARDLAARAGDVAIAFHAVAELAPNGGGSALDMKAQVLATATAAAATPDASKHLAEVALSLANVARDAEEFDRSVRFAGLAEQAVAKAEASDLRPPSAPRPGAARVAADRSDCGRSWPGSGAPRRSGGQPPGRHVVVFLPRPMVARPALPGQGRSRHPARPGPRGWLGTRAQPHARQCSKSLGVSAPARGDPETMQRDSLDNPPVVGPGQDHHLAAKGFCHARMRNAGGARIWKSLCHRIVRRRATSTCRCALEASHLRRCRRPRTMWPRRRPDYIPTVTRTHIYRDYDPMMMIKQGVAAPA